MSMSDDKEVKARHTTDEFVCPVCQRKCPTKESVAQACPTCGFEPVGVRWFANKQTAEAYSAQVNAFRSARSTTLREALREPGRFEVFSRGVAFVDADKTLRIVDAYGDVNRQDEVMQFSASRRHEVILRADGTVEGRGSNDDGQIVLADLKDAVQVLASVNCTYVLLSDGSVTVRGACSFRDEVSALHGVASISCGSYHLAALLRDGTVRFASSRLEALGVFSQPCDWQGIVQLASSDTCTVGLSKDGSVHFVGALGDGRQKASQWTGIKSISAGGGFVLGLTAAGNVRLASTTTAAMLDRGRSFAGGWEHMLVTACGSSSVAGITNDGNLVIAGVMPGKEMTLKAWAKELPIKL